MNRGWQASLMVLALALACPSARGQQETPPPPGPPRSVRFPTPVEKTLPNGLRVIVAPRPESVPLVTALLLIKTGAEADPPALGGLADMTANLLTKGTKTRTAPEIAEAIEALGGSLDAGARWDASTVSVNVASARLPQALEILADVARNPVFKEDEIERQRRQTLDSRDRSRALSPRASFSATLLMPIPSRALSRPCRNSAAMTSCAFIRRTTGRTTPCSSSVGASRLLRPSLWPSAFSATGSLRPRRCRRQLETIARRAQPDRASS